MDFLGTGYNVANYNKTGTFLWNVNETQSMLKLFAWVFLLFTRVLIHDLIEIRCRISTLRTHYCAQLKEKHDRSSVHRTGRQLHFSTANDKQCNQKT